ncbi:MAG: PDZ domain-containing protein [Planctomycetota bacterium]|jgi:membrane-associated protease RseP (regulator of RpoE activity)
MARIHFAIIALSAVLGGSTLTAAEARLSSTSIELDGGRSIYSAGWLGVLLDPAADRPRVAEVIPDSPAEKAGVRPGDVFLAVGDAKVRDIDDLQRLLGDAAVGSDVLLVLDRDGDKIELEVTLGERPAEGVPAPRPPEKPPAKGDPGDPGGLKRQEPPSRPDQESKQDAGRAYLGVSVVAARRGVRIERVVDGSPAERAGLRAGDLLRGLDGREIDDLDDLDKAMGRLRPGQKVRVDFIRGGDRRDMDLKLGRAAEEGDAPAATPDKPKSQPTSKPKPVPVPVPVKKSEKKIGAGDAGGVQGQDPKARVSVQSDRSREIEAELERAREQMARERANLERELRRAQERNAEEMQRANKQLAEAQAQVESELERARREMERERERSQKEMNRERQELEREMRKMQEEVVQEAERMRREMEKERRAMESELKKIQKEADREMRRAHEQMEAERKQVEREIQGRQKAADEEMRSMQRAVEKERQAIEKELQRSQAEAAEEIARQRERVNEELARARDEMDRERRRMSQDAGRSRTPPAGPRQNEARPQSADLEKRLSGMRREFDRIRAELRELQSILEKKRR